MSRPVRLILFITSLVLGSSLIAAEPAELAALRGKAERGNGLAMYNLGLAYAQGDGVAVDLPEAFVWLSLASENGATGKALDTVLGNISDEQLNEGRKRLGQHRAALAARAAAAQLAARRPGPREFTLSTVPTTTKAAPVVVSPSPTGPVTPSPRVNPPNEPMVPRQTVAPEATDEVSRLKAELARANAKIDEQAATIARLREEVRRLLPVTSVAAPRTSPADGM